MKDLRDSINHNDNKSTDLENQRSVLLNNILIFKAQLDYLDLLIEKQPENQIFYEEEKFNLKIKLAGNESQLDLANKILSQKIIIK
ncbi:hypothetical protein [Acinetobacter sp. YH12134]|uniref:hypothetical protein n=1 Tax=Acinetobacter sp. YH12134 TaxID=2601118 RepID=UPI0015D1F152|nr:hypothetical protein [Acinetobacter sp. YH12134]